MIIDMDISVIIPTYKPQWYLWECLDSLRHQTFPKVNFEVVLVLNGCLDPYDSLIREYMSGAKEINWKYIQTNQGGVSNARNIALNASTGEYITFVDDDDILSVTYLEELYSKATPVVISLCYPLSFREDLKHTESYYITSDYDRNAGNGPIPFQKAKKYFSGPVYKLIHKDVIGDRRFNVNFRNGEDSLFMFLISDRFKLVDFTSKNAIYYRRVRPNSATTTALSYSDVVKNRFHLIWAFSKIYVQAIRTYSFSFYCSRILASIHAIFDKLLN